MTTKQKSVKETKSSITKITEEMMPTDRELIMRLNKAMKGIEDKTMTASAANAISSATGKILSIIRVRLDYAKARGITPSLDGFIPLTDADIPIAKK